MKTETIHVLLVEDDFRFVALLEAWLEATSEAVGKRQGMSLHLQHVGDLAAALFRLGTAPFDLVLADLNLPDSHGLATCERLLNHTAGVPVIILSGIDDEDLAIQAMGKGAQDYLVKGSLDEQLLLRSVRYALERSKLQRELEQMRQVQLQIREQEALDRINARGGMPMAAQSLGLQSLSQSQPEVFAGMVDRLVVTWEHLLEMRTHKVSYNISQDLRELACDMGLRKCGPRDVVALYRAALARLERIDKPQRSEILREEGRYLTFELMGNLVSHYRPYALDGLPHSSRSGGGARQPPPPKGGGL